MINKIIRFSIQNKLIVGVFIAILLAFGGYSLKNLPIDAVPDITNNQVQVITFSPTLAAEEIERFITYPVELQMATIPGVIEIRSVSRFGLSVITIVFKDEVEMLDARQMVGERIAMAQQEIPQGLGNPEMAPVTTGLGEIFQYMVQAKPGYENKYSAMELRTIQDWIVKRQLLGTKGVAEVSSFGGFVKQYEVAMNPEKLRGMNVTIPEIFKALQLNNQNTGGAYIDKKPTAYFIRGVGLIEDTTDIDEIVVKNVNGIPVLMRDVAEVRMGYANRYGAMTYNDQGEVVGAIVLMLKGENSAEVVGNVKERIEKISKTLPEGIEIVPFLDRSDLVDRAIKTVSKNLIEGALIVIFVLVVFLGNIRAGLIVASVIPLSMLFAISLMYLFGVSGNLMSLGAIDFGLIVDGAVIIVESVIHNLVLKHPSLNRRLTQNEMNEEIYSSATKMMNSAAFGQIIILIVYLPILALVGIEGKMFRPMAQAVSFAILGALILCVTYVPMMASLFLSKKISQHKNLSDKIMEVLQKAYHPVINAALNARIIIVSVAVALLGISILLFINMGGEFLPTLEEGDFAVETRLLPGSSLSQTIETSLKASDILLRKFPEVKLTVGKIGTAEIPTDPMPMEACDLMIILKDKDEWTSAETREELAEKMSKELERLPGVNFGFQQPIQMRFNELMTGAKQDLAIKIFGENMEVLASKANQVANLIKDIKGVSDIYVEPVTGLPQITVKYKRGKIAQYGLAISDVNDVVRSSFAGAVAGEVFEGEKRFDLVVRLQEPFRRDIKDVKGMYVVLPSGMQIPITEVADIEYSEGPIQISREDTKRRIVIGVNVRDRDVESMVQEISSKLDAKLDLPAGYFVTYGGQFENLVEAKQRLSLAVPVALGLILIILFFTFKSLKETLLIFTAIPFSAIGGVFALLLRDMPFSISAGVGFIALFGVAVLNGMVLISYFNQLKAEGIENVYERVLKGTEMRLRPVIMTASVASMGFLPMALSNTSGAEVQKPLATVVIGGLISATLLTLIVLPVLYTLFYKNEDEGGGAGIDKAFVLIPLFILGSVSLSLGQAPVKALSAEEAFNIALQNNPSMAAARYDIKAQEALKKSYLDIPKTNVSLMYGQFNSLNNDNNITINQSIAFPTFYSSQNNYYREQVKASEVKADVTGNELKRNVRSAYYNLLYFESKHMLLNYEDSIYQDFMKAADLRFKTGESTYLEKLTAEAQVAEFRNLILKNHADMQIYQKQLRVYLNVSDSIITTEKFDKLNLSVSPDSATVEANPLLSYIRQQVKVNKAFVRVERARFLPDFSFGYFNQTLQGVQSINGTERYFGPGYRFQGIMAGVSVPVIFKPYYARITSVKLNQKVTESLLEYNTKNLEGEYAMLMQQYKKNLSSLSYFESIGLKQAELIISNSIKAFRAGEIGYVEYLQGLGRALSIKSGYLDTINNYNQTIIAIDYIAGGN
ncbi:MAG: CusA/CzcA family heavy metal efflux RND transporter [Sporocytophaga sp.]|uniref:CusA/CzcA family heavy metal efflux RND transporter n=1 Tax=Sporocytophaga sp. TaxID=2231183 RepID=UPI001B1A6594|nr:CusA/CzcA family heavy metal efflux RND transporter [Sporocytophaga sp.]MBO9701435.1 CusA/CzcA family heavy metal efflux RND transporter [Sporocytophaga sp.]